MSTMEIDLIPWDADSPEHIERLLEQRDQCGWNAGKVEPVWRPAQKAGSSCIYWIVLRPDDTGYVSSLLDKLVARYPNEATPLTDTAPAIRAVPRTPSGTPFRPVGHITVDDSQPAVLRYGLDIPTVDAFWIKSLYVSYALQGTGIGRAAMDAIERLATEPPLSARHLLIDTLHREDQLDEEMAMAYHGAVPKSANQDWYHRRGYRLIGEILNLYDDNRDRSGKAWDLRAVILRRDL